MPTSQPNAWARSRQGQPRPLCLLWAAVPPSSGTTLPRTLPPWPSPPPSSGEPTPNPPPARRDRPAPMLQSLQPSAFTRSCLLLPHLPSAHSRLQGRGRRPRHLLLLPIGYIFWGMAPQFGLRGQLERPSPLVVGLESKGGWRHGAARRRRNSNNFIFSLLCSC